MLHLANIMQYDDDFDDQNFYSNKNKKQRQEQVSSSSSEEDIDSLSAKVAQPASGPRVVT